MKVETKEIVYLTEEEQRLLDKAYGLILEIDSDVKNKELSNLLRTISDGLIDLDSWTERE
jgi:hypothetical protein